MRALLALLRAQYWHYQNAHWTVKGAPFYGDHLMFQRIYESLQPQIDTLAEKAVAFFGGEVVEPIALAALMQGWLRRWSSVDCLHKRSLMSEDDFQQAVKGVYDAMKASGSLSLGMDDFLLAMANDHETNTYLVQQTRRAHTAALRIAGEKIPGGLAKGKEPSDFDQGQLAKGTKVELEHTDDKAVAREIAEDHLTEDPDYYKKLEKIEKHAEMSSLEKTWGGYSSFRPNRHGEALDDDGGEQTDLLDENDDLMANWFKTTDDEGYFRPAPQWDQLQDWAQSDETPVLDEQPFSGWTLAGL